MREITQQALLPRWLTAFLSRSSREMPACHFLSVDADLNQHPVTKVRWVSPPPPQPHLCRRKSYGTLKQQFILRFSASFHPPTPQLMVKRVMLWWPTHCHLHLLSQLFSCIVATFDLWKTMGHLNAASWGKRNDAAQKFSILQSEEGISWQAVSHKGTMLFYFWMKFW